jgi:peptidyl-prolyl cis-trans isomerase D
MLEALREKSSGWIAIVVLGFLALLIGLSGIQGYELSTMDNSVAKVGDFPIPPERFSQAWSRYTTQLQQAGQDQASFDTLEKKREFLDRLVDQELIRQGAADAGLVPSLPMLQKQIAAMPYFQTDGKFDKALYQQILSQNRTSEAEFVQSLREEYQSNVLPSALMETGLVTDREVDEFIKLRDQTRDFNVFSVDTNDLPVAVAPSETEIKTYYDANTAKFMSQEQADFEYLRVQPSMLKPTEITDALLKERYTQQATRFKTPELRQAAHVLIEVEGGANAAPEAQKAASEKALAIAVRARAGEDFAAIARAESKDLGSAAGGGDLGMLEKGVTQPAFEAKLFSMQVNEISDPVLTDDGYHVIKLAAIEAERGKSFEEARVELESEVKIEELSRAYNQMTGKLVDISQRDPQTLQSAAKELGLTTVKTGLITRVGGADPVAQNQEFLKAAFADRIIKDAQNSALVKLGENDGVVFRMSVYKKSEPKPIAEVKAEITALLSSERQAKALKAKADSILAEIRGGKAFAAVATANSKTVEAVPGAGRNSVNRAPELTADVFKSAFVVGSKPVYFTTVQGQDRVSIVELTAVKDADPKSIDTASRESIRSQLKSERSAAEYFGLQKAIRARTEVTVHEDRLADQ